jgi:DNA-binding response OmpR family regulator
MGNKILVADDSKLVVSLVRNIFQSQDGNFTVIIAADGKEAIEKTEKEQPDLILMDWQMPEMNGIEALQVLKANSSTAGIPVIMLTASETTAEAFEHGAIDFIQKPFNKDELIARVKTSLDAVNSKKELKQKLIDLEIQKDKLKLQNEILVRQKKEINANKIQAALIHRLISPNIETINSLFEEYFTLSMPVNEIPTNFFWVSKHNNISYCCIGFQRIQSTSSVLMSSGMMNVLNELISTSQNEKELQPSEMLYKLAGRLSETICSDDYDIRFPDMVLCAIDMNKNTLQYSGVNVPIYVLKNEKLVELRTDKITPSTDITEIKFTNHKVQLAPNDLIYILNDGFNNSKVALMEDAYISDELLALMKKMYSKEMTKQRTMFMKTFDNWKKDLKQVNDIFVLGVKV